MIIRHHKRHFYIVRRSNFRIYDEKMTKRFNLKQLKKEAHIIRHNAHLNTATTYSELVPIRNFPPHIPIPLLT